MRDFKRLLTRLPVYMRTLGGMRGLRTAWAIERDLPTKATTSRSFSIPPYGDVWLRDCRSDHSIFWQCLIRRQYDIRSFAQFEQLHARYAALAAANIQPLIIDCGANVGLSAIWFAHAFPKARILAVEPDRENLAMIERNIASLDGRVQPVLGGVWGHSTTLAIANPSSGPAAYHLEDSAEKNDSAIRAYTMNELISLAGTDRVLIAKIDIEGGQTSVFAENTEWVDKTDAILIELDDWQRPWSGSSTAFFRCLSLRNFDYVLHGETLCCFQHAGEPS
jgi:FkbM family methyltransferase